MENRLRDLQTFIRGIADTNSDIAKHLDSSPSLFSELPSLYVQPFVQVHEEEEKILKDSRTGEEYLISTETGLLKYLKANFVIDLEVRPIELPLGDETFEFTKTKLFLLALDNRSVKSFNLHKAFELGAWLTAAERIYRTNKEGVKSGKPFREWVYGEVKLTKDYISKIKSFYIYIQPYQKFLQCSIPLRFALKNARRFALIMEINQQEKEFWSTG